MRCSQVKKKLPVILAGECTYSEQTKIHSHLAYCRRCAQELENLKHMDGFLDGLEPEEAPPELLDSIMKTVEKVAAGRPGSRLKSASPYSLPDHTRGKKSVMPGVLRDLTSAAAAALAIFWLGTGWFGSLTAVAEKSFSRTVSSYVHYTETALYQTQNSISVIKDDLFCTVDKISLPQNIKKGK